MMKKVNRFLVLMFALLIAVSPVLASRAFVSNVGTDDTDALVVFRSSTNPITLTHLTVKTDAATGEPVVVYGSEPGNYITMTTVATASGSIILTVSSTAGVAVDDWIVVEDLVNTEKFEAVQISIITAEVLTVDDLTYAYAKGAKIFEVSAVGRFYPTYDTATNYDNATSLVGVRARSPMMLRVTAETDAVLSGAGYYSDGQ